MSTIKLQFSNKLFDRAGLREDT